MIYLASAYSARGDNLTADDKAAIHESRYREALRCLAYYTKGGKAMFSPIVHSHPMLVHHTMPGDWEFWQNIDREIIRCCNTLWILGTDRWKQSVGIRAEVAIAARFNLPLRFINLAGDGYVDTGMFYGEFEARINGQ